MKLLTRIELFSTRFRGVFRSTALMVLLLACGLGAVTWAKHDHDSLANVPTISDAVTVAHASETDNAIASVAFSNARTPIRIESEHVTLRRTGFQPSEITRPAGPFLLSIDNKSEMGEMSFRVLRESGSNERELRHKNDKFRLRQVVDLEPGRYTLSEANHPEWTCRIRITAQ